MRLTVTRRETMAQHVVGLTLADLSGARLPAWMPGAHIDVTGPTGVTRQYSLCGALAQRHEWKVAVLREPDGRGGSAAIHDLVSEGTVLEVDGPRNHFRLVDSPRYLFIAGGIGIAPIVPMIDLLEHQDEFAGRRPWHLLYTGRARANMAFAERFERHADRVTTFESRSGGRVDLDPLLDIQTPTAVFCCGPEGLIEAVAERCERNHRLEFHAERFSPIIDPEAAAHGAAFTVEFTRSGQTLHVRDGQTILEAMEDAGLAPTCSCREGVCGTCETRVLEGVPDHRDSVLEQHERAQGETMMICVSRSRTLRLVLDA